MSPANWFREQNTGKNPKNYQVKNYSNGIKTNTLNNTDQIATDLFTELQGVLSENVQLKHENCSLKSELEELRIQHDNLLLSIETNKTSFEQDLNKLQNEIKVNETNLIDNSRKCLIQQKKFLEEIKELKSKNENLKLEIATKETVFIEKTKNLESEIKILELSSNSIKSQNEDLVKKSNRYKNKLKYAITIINDLNNLLIDHTTKPDTSESETQTQYESSKHDLASRVSSNSTSDRSKCNLDSENLLLSDIFFKSKSFCESELLFCNKDVTTGRISRNSSLELDVDN